MRAKWHRWKGTAAYLLLAVATAYSIGQTQASLDNFEGEVEERRGQSCRLFETDHLADVTRLKGTYRYLDKVIQRGEQGQTINQFVIRGLPMLEEEARTDTAPKFCDLPGVGLPEPDPALPRKRDFRRYVQR